MFRINKINSILIFLIVLLTFLGFYSLIIIAVNLFGNDSSRFIAIPLRLLICFLLMSVFFVNLNQGIHFKPIYKYYFVFSILFIFRIIYEELNLIEYYIDHEIVLLYFLSFSLIPFTVLSSVSFNAKSLRAVFLAIIIGGICFSVLTLFFYQNVLGAQGRLGSSSDDDNVINPLIISYNSILVVGVSIFYLMYNKTSRFLKLTLIFLIVLSFVPFLFGASRGSLVAITIPLCFAIYNSTFKYRLRALILTIGLLFGLFFFDSYFESGLFNRFQDLDSSSSNYDDSSIRLIIWKDSFNQFLNNPIFGDKLAVDNWKNYPHNIIVEVLQTTGVVGFVAFVILLFFTIQKVNWIFKFHKQYIWVCVLFLQSFTQNLFSGNIYTGAWFWTSIALVVGTFSYLKNYHAKQPK